MIGQSINYYIHHLQEQNYKSFYLAFLRVAISVWQFKELCINWSSFDVLYGEGAFVVNKPNFISRLPGGFPMVTKYFWWLIIPYIGVIWLNIIGIGRWVTALALFILVDLLHKMNMSFLNGGDKMAKLILLYLVFADSYQYFVWKKKKDTADSQRSKRRNLLSNLAALSIMLQLCVAYFGTGLAKLMDSFWRSGEAVYYALLMERFMGTSFNHHIVQYKWLVISATYFVLLFELLFPVLIWIKKLRKPLLVAGILLHAGIYIFLMIYGFQIVFLLIYGLFLANDRLVEVTKKIVSGLRFIGWKDGRIGVSLRGFIGFKDRL